MRYHEDFSQALVWDYDARYELTEEEIREVGRARASIMPAAHAPRNGRPLVG
jgi:hypothetical protein